MVFRIYNHLRAPISVVAHFPSGATAPFNVLESLLSASSSTALSMSTMARVFANGTLLKVYVHNMVDAHKRDWTTTPSKTLFGEYNLVMEELRSLKAFHVGMITSRWISMSTAYQMAMNGLNNVQGVPWVIIHNEGNSPLRLNWNIVVAPHSSIRYKGRDHFGVRLGTVFTDQDHLYPQFIFTIPATDIYYGITSDTEQSLFGGYQETKTFDPVNDGIIFPLQMGWQGGPATPSIPFGYIPQMGKRREEAVDRWGQSVNVNAIESLLENPVGTPVYGRTFST